MTGRVYFVSGIDTHIGKTYVTGYLAKTWNTSQQKTITQKLIQTGNIDVSEDILKHREIMGIGLQACDEKKWTMPEIFSYPASPHLAAELENRTIDFEHLKHTTQLLQNDYDVVLLEGAGGLMVPLTQNDLTIEYVQKNEYPVILVTSGRLGSINHTLLSLLAIQQYNIDLYAVAYNHFDDHQDQTIAQETQQYLQQYLQKHFPHALWLDIPKL